MGKLEEVLALIDDACSRCYVRGKVCHKACTVEEIRKIIRREDK